MRADMHEQRGKAAEREQQLQADFYMVRDHENMALAPPEDFM
jgi:hypothetical protein